MEFDERRPDGMRVSLLGLSRLIGVAIAAPVFRRYSERMAPWLVALV
jgi:hypothetical protein